MEFRAKIYRLEKYKLKLSMWQDTRDPKIRSAISQDSAWVRQEVIRAGCFGTLTLTPPPMVVSGSWWKSEKASRSGELSHNSHPLGGGCRRMTPWKAIAGMEEQGKQRSRV